jgi:hypothetical protein
VVAFPWCPRDEADLLQTADLLPVGHHVGVPDDSDTPARVRGAVYAVGLEGHDRAAGRGGELAAGVRPDDDVAVVHREVHELYGGQRLPGVDDPAHGHLSHQPQALIPRQVLEGCAVEVHTIQDACHRGLRPRVQGP